MDIRILGYWMMVEHTKAACLLTNRFCMFIEYLNISISKYQSSPHKNIFDARSLSWL